MRQLIFFVAQFIFIGTAFAANFQCESMFSTSLQVDQINRCNSLPVEKLSSADKTSKTDFNNHLYASMLKANNLGGIKVLFPNSQEKKIVYRSAYLIGAPFCINQLSKSGVNTVVNLYSGKTGYGYELSPLEKAMFKANNIQNYIHIKGYMVDESTLTPQELDAKIAEIIKTIALAKGNVLIHCYTGEHDTGVIFGILNKCYNRQSIQSIERNTMCHMDYRSNYGQKTFKRAMDIIKQFPCELLAQS